MCCFPAQVTKNMFEMSRSSVDWSLETWHLLVRKNIVDLAFPLLQSHALHTQWWDPANPRGTRASRSEVLRGDCGTSMERF